MANQRQSSRKRLRRTKEKEVALTSPVAHENLPLPRVHYPNHYGTFFAFSQAEFAEPVICSCAKSAIQNYMRLRSSDLSLNADPLRMAPLDSWNFPDCIARFSLRAGRDPISCLRFNSRICHRCQLATPSLRYCTAMYGGKFKQTFGWYINQNIFRSGVDRSLFMFVPDVCPPDIQELICELNADMEKRNRLVQSVTNSEAKVLGREVLKLDREIPKLRRNIWNIFENETRREFGVRKIGEAWVSENILFQIVVRLFPNHDCIRHWRPSWLEGLELDIFVTGEGIAFEYQGQQHFFAVEHWGGRKALDSLQRRDERKAKLCRLHQVLLIPIDFTEPLTEQHIRHRIDATRKIAQKSYRPEK